MGKKKRAKIQAKLKEKEKQQIAVSKKKKSHFLKTIMTIGGLLLGTASYLTYDHIAKNEFTKRYSFHLMEEEKSGPGKKYFKIGGNCDITKEIEQQIRIPFVKTCQEITNRKVTAMEINDWTTQNWIEPLDSAFPNLERKIEEKINETYKGINSKYLKKPTLIIRRPLSSQDMKEPKDTTAIYLANDIIYEIICSGKAEFKNRHITFENKIDWRNVGYESRNAEDPEKIKHKYTVISTYYKNIDVIYAAAVIECLHTSLCKYTAENVNKEIQKKENSLKRKLSQTEKREILNSWNPREEGLVHAIGFYYFMRNKEFDKTAIQAEYEKEKKTNNYFLIPGFTKYLEKYGYDAIIEQYINGKIKYED